MSRGRLTARTNGVDSESRSVKTLRITPSADTLINKNVQIAKSHASSGIVALET